MKAVIMAGGHGTRIRAVASDIPKPMIPVLGKPVLQYQIECLRENGITEIILVTGYLAESIHEYFGDGSAFGVQLTYFNEDSPMGTAGALHYLAEKLDEDFLLLMGDLMLSVDFGRFMAFHKETGSDVTLFVHPNSHPYDSDIIVTDTVGRLSDFTEARCGIGAAASGEDRASDMHAANAACAGGKNSDPDKREEVRRSLVTEVISKKADRTGLWYHNSVNAGIYAMKAKVAAVVPEPVAKVDLDKDIIRPLIAEGKVSAYHSTEYVKDMGTPERYEEVTEAVRSGLVEQRNLKSPQQCIFLDRDGTINVENGFIRHAEDMELLPGAAEAIRRINASRYLAVVVTNQPVIARGECSFEELDRIHKKMETLLGAKGAYIDALLYCPHHKDKGFAGEVADLKFPCACRKPAAGLVEQAAKELNIDLASSWMIGDMTQDIRCGHNAGLHTMLVKTGMGGADGKYDDVAECTASDLGEAVSLILER